MNAPANKGKTYRPEPLTAAECRLLLRHCGRGLTGIRNRAVIAVLWRCGLRAAELVELHPKDIDAEAGTLRVMKGKGDKARTVGLDPEALVFIERWLEARKAWAPRRGTLFCTLKGKPLGTAYLRRLLPRLAARAGIQKRVHPHGLRHTFARELAGERVPLRVIQGALGHEHAHTTSDYLGRVAAPEVVEAMHARPTWEPSDERGRSQGVLGLPEPRNATSESHGEGPRQTERRHGGPAIAAPLLALALLPRGQLPPTR